VHGDAWFSDVADELARCLVDAEAAAEACEKLLETVQQGGDSKLRQIVVDGLIAPAAVARVLVELIDQPPRLVLAACRLYCESAAVAVVRLESLGSRVDSADAVAALRTASGSCERLLEAAG
jgi:hypothetical protein